jgi:GNAT superfamily N-acetyltransferase
MSSSLVVRPPAAADHDRWRDLWAGYNAFYRARVPEEVTDALWMKLLAPEADVRGLLAERAGEVVGFTHYLFHASTWNLNPNCYLEDLYVDPDARGGGVARPLIEAVEAAARAKGAFRLYWHTQEYNAPARSLYDSIIPRSSFIVYRKAL